jgi:uncharacterized protein with NAD-binding domain and iron-sulfur cluster
LAPDPPILVPPDGGGPHKVAVLGGGAAGLAAAFELTRPDRKRLFDVTVYQLGWRLGGKGASGRNMAPGKGARIEEHGLHMWFGFYANAFAMMKQVYDELGRKDDEPLATVEKAFTPCHSIVLYDRQRAGWAAMSVSLPTVEGNPWDPQPSLPDFWQIAGRMAHLLWAALIARPTEEDPLPPVPDAQADFKAAEEYARRGRRRGIEVADDEVLALEKIFGRARDRLKDAWEGIFRDRPRARLIFATADTAVAMIRGIRKDGILKNPEGFDSVNGEDWAEWLKRHGAHQMTIGENPAVRSPILRAVYDVAFCFPRGSIGAADAAAGTAMNDLLRLAFTYRGAPYYKMNAGMGDAIFAPLYEVLKRRGVKFEFFHAVSELISKDGRNVDEIKVIRQVNLKGAGYDPLIGVKRLPSWPSEPLWGQLEDDAQQKARAPFDTDLDPLGRKGTDTITLKRGPDKDFEYVVLGIPVGAHGVVAKPLMAAQPRFAEMVDESHTVATQAFQVWTRTERKDLGATSGPESVSATFVEPLDTYCDMSHLIKIEDWPRSEVGGIAYVCGVLEDVRDDEPADDARERVRKAAVDFIEKDLRHIWMKVAKGATPWSHLHDPADGKDADRFRAQYHRANVAKWERYVITPKGSVKFRRKAHESCFENLALAGDWTKNGVDGGCVEAAVMSGLQAGRALWNDMSTTIVGEDPRWMNP